MNNFSQCVKKKLNNNFLTLYTYEICYNNSLVCKIKKVMIVYCFYQIKTRIILLSSGFLSQKILDL